MLAATCYADDVVLFSASVAAAEVTVAEVIEKLKQVDLTVGAQKTHWTSHPKIVDRSIVVDGMAVLRQELLEFVWTGAQDIRSRTHQLKPTKVWRNGDLF